MAQDVSIVIAQGTLTLSGQPLNTETVVIGSKTYTFQTTLTDVDGNVKIGADAEGSIKNLYAALKLSNDGESAVGAGTDYAASMTRHPSCEPISKSATTLVVGAPGEGANHIPSTETLTNGSWGAATLASGSGNVSYWVGRLIALNQINSEVAYEVLKLSAAAD